jgi:hypothetical protein
MGAAVVDVAGVPNALAVDGWPNALAAGAAA